MPALRLLFLAATIAACDAPVPAPVSPTPAAETFGAGAPDPSYYADRATRQAGYRGPRNAR